MGGDAIRVLMVEDSEPDARLLAEALREVGATAFQLTKTKRLAEALEKLDQQQFDVALLDLTLPDSVGLDTFRRLRGKQPSLPIVVLTGLDDETVSVRAVHEGAQDYIIKGDATGHVLVRSMRYAIERQRLVSQLRASEASYRIIATNADGLVVVDRKDTIRFANPATAAITGRSVPELVGTRFGHPLAAGQTSEFIVHTAKGRRDIEMSVVEMEWEGESAHLASLRDITEKRALEEQLFQAQKMEVLGRMAGGLAHDFNNILTGITGNVELALLDCPPGTPLSGHIEEIGESAERASKLIRQLLAFSRRETTEARVIDVNQVLRDAEKMLKRLLGERVELVTSYDPKLRTISADRSQLEQIILNLAVNAGDAIAENGHLSVETRMVRLEESTRERPADAEPGEYVAIVVRDDGAGMNRETLLRIFEPFFTTKAAGKGTGLGLSTVYGIVRRFGGSIQVDSEAGRGTTFRIYFPPRDEPAESSVDLPLITESAPRGSETILIVDDDRTVRGLLERVLSGAGYRVLVASDGKDALGQIAGEKGPIDLLLSDVVMPEMNGPDLFARLRERDPGLKAIFISGYAEDVMARDADLWEGLPLVRKPFRLHDVAVKVREVLDAI